MAQLQPFMKWKLLYRFHSLTVQSSLMLIGLWLIKIVKYLHGYHWLSQPQCTIEFPRGDSREFNNKFKNQ